MSSKKIVLISTDGESFEIDENVARKMPTISHMIDDGCACNDAPIHLQYTICTGDILALVIEYCKNTCDQDDKVLVDSIEAEIHDDHVEKGKGKEVAEELDHVEKGNEDHVEKGNGKEGIWDATAFMNKLDRETILKVILAANYLNFQSLLELSCRTVAEQIEDMNIEEVRKFFNVESDFTPEEEEKIRKENAWAFEAIKPKMAINDSETTEESGSDTKEDDSKTKEGGSDTAKEDDSKTTKEGGSDTTKEADSKTNEEGGLETTKGGDSKTTKDGGSETTKGDDSKTTEECDSETTKGGDSETTEEASKAQEE